MLEIIGRSWLMSAFKERECFQGEEGKGRLKELVMGAGGGQGVGVEWQGRISSQNLIAVLRKNSL